jgi:hypothetical protein
VWSLQSDYNKSKSGLSSTEQRLHQSVEARNRQLKEILHMQTLLELPGQPDVRAGQVVIVNYPSTRLLSPGSDNISDPVFSLPTPLYSGKHLVTAVHHMLTTNAPGSMTYRMMIKVNKDSFSSPLIGAKD